MPRLLLDQIHSNFSSDTGIWYDYRTGISVLFTGAASGAKQDFNDHVMREYNKKVFDLSLPTGYYFSPFDGGRRYTE